MKRNRAGGHRRPSAVGNCYGLSSFPGEAGAGLSSGVRELDTRNGALPFDKPGDPRQRGDVLILPKTQVSGADAAFGRYRSCLDNNKRGSSNRTAAQVNQMPVGGETIVARVLAHGRYRNAIAEGNITQGQG